MKKVTKLLAIISFIALMFVFVNFERKYYMLTKFEIYIHHFPEVLLQIILLGVTIFFALKSRNK